MERAANSSDKQDRDDVRFFDGAIVMTVPTLDPNTQQIYLMKKPGARKETWRT